MKTIQAKSFLSVAITLFSVTTKYVWSQNQTSLQISSWGHTSNNSLASTPVVRQMFFLDSTTGWVVGENGWIVKTTSGGIQWTQQTPSTQNNIYYVFFVDKNIGWISGHSGMIMKTTDGGNTWFAQTSGTNIPVLSLFFVNANQGWAAVGDSGIILSTQNGGNTWTRQRTNVGMQLRNTVFVDENHGWICGDSGAIVHTSNGGITWSPQNTNTTTYLWWIDFVDSLHGFSAGGRYTDNSTIFLKTTNGGTTWTSQTPAVAPLFATDFINPDTGWVVGRWGTVLKTTDGGSTWNSQGYDAYWLSQISFMTEKIGYAITGSPILICTSNGGESWFIRDIIPLATTGRALEISDVPNDNGKQVFIRWTTSGSPIDMGISVFSIYRFDRQAWTYIKDVPVTRDTLYQAIVPTIYDSTIIHGIFYSVFRIIGRTSNPSVYSIIGPDSSYSLDNLPPLAPVNGTAVQLSDGNVVIRWQPTMNMFGDLMDYVVYRSLQPDFSGSSVARIGPVLDTVYIDNTTGGSRFYYRITSRDYSGNESPPLVILTMASVQLVNPQIPESNQLGQNYPNPFNPSTQIQFGIARAGLVTLSIFDLSGKTVGTLISQELMPGNYRIDFSASHLSAGVYLYRLQSGEFSETKKMLLIK